MNADLIAVVRARLEAQGLAGRSWASLVTVACHGRDALEALLATGVVPDTERTPVETKPPAGTYLRSLTVQGFRGIGAPQTLDVTPGPGLTLVVGRNGSGKSSFAEALEVLFTGDSRRWSDRSKIWKEGWRNLHKPHPAAIDAVVLLEGEGPARIACVWDEGAPLEARRAYVQPKSRPKTTIAALGWDAALVSYRPFLSYNELGSMLDEGPSKLYDALSMVLGLEDLVTALDALSKARLSRQKAFDAADEARKALVDRLTTRIQEDPDAESGAVRRAKPDTRAAACRDALASASWGLDAIAQIVDAADAPQPDRAIGLLQRALALDPGDADRVAGVVSGLREADRQLEAVAGSDAEASRQTIGLLESALEFHASHGDADCPVCGSASALTGRWARKTRAEIERLRRIAAGADSAHRAAGQARRAARDLLAAPPALLAQLSDVAPHGLDGLDAAREQWTAWHEGASVAGLPDLAAHLEMRHAPLAAAVERLTAAAAAEIRRREDRWRPFAEALRDWLPQARAAREGAARIPQIRDAEAWLKAASGELRDARFAPIAKKAMAAWAHLRQHSSVQLGSIELAGSRTTRKVTLDVTVDGVRGAALGVMSQGELHSLALSLFLPRATLPESPFRFVVIDDPVQSMDPARIDGLARALDETARTRQVIVFTHDDRLPEAIRRMGIRSTILSVTRRRQSVVEVRTALDPVQAHIEDALALAHTAQMPMPVVRRVVPGMCRLAIEAALMRVVRRRRLAAGITHAAVEEELAANATLTPLAALALFGDGDRGSDVVTGLNNKVGRWAGDVFSQCKAGAHQGTDGDLLELIRGAEKLTAKLLELK